MENFRFLQNAVCHQLDSCCIFFVADEAYPLKPYIMRPYPGKSLNNEKNKIFNYRMSRARRVVENAFGILVSRWRMFWQPIIAKPENAIKYVKAAEALHNFLRSEEPNMYCLPQASQTLKMQTETPYQENCAMMQ